MQKKGGVFTVEVVRAVQEVELRRRCAHRIGDDVRVALGRRGFGKLHRRAGLPKREEGGEAEGEDKSDIRRHPPAAAVASFRKMQKAHPTIINPNQSKTLVMLEPLGALLVDTVELNCSRRFACDFAEQAGSRSEAITGP